MFPDSWPIVKLLSIRTPGLLKRGRFDIFAYNIRAISHSKGMIAMLVSVRDKTVVLVTQPNHGRSCGVFVEAWGNDTFSRPEPFDCVHYAAAHHDDGWQESDEKVLFDTDTNLPMNFLAVDLFDHPNFYRAGMQQAAARDEYAGLLVGMHWIGLYNNRWGTQQGLTFEVSPELREHLDGVGMAEEKRWAEIKPRLWDRGTLRSLLESELWRNYELVQAWDFLSLFVCLNDMSRPTKHEIPLVPTSGDEKVNLTLTVRTGGVIEVNPYPFNVDQVVVEIPCKTIPADGWSNEQEARERIRDAAEQNIVARFVPTS